MVTCSAVAEFIQCDRPLDPRARERRCPPKYPKDDRAFCAHRHERTDGCAECFRLGGPQVRTARAIASPYGLGNEGPSVGIFAVERSGASISFALERASIIHACIRECRSICSVSPEASMPQIKACRSMADSVGNVPVVRACTNVATRTFPAHSSQSITRKSAPWTAAKYRS